ncbi:MAG TPA: hypothetical protein VIC62_13920, partial [Nakamurella sp.]
PGQMPTHGGGVREPTRRRAMGLMPRSTAADLAPLAQYAPSSAVRRPRWRPSRAMAAAVPSQRRE